MRQSWGWLWQARGREVGCIQCQMYAQGRELEGVPVSVKWLYLHKSRNVRHGSSRNNLDIELSGCLPLSPPSDLHW